MTKVTKKSFKTYQLPMYANLHKQQALWDLYDVYTVEYKHHIKDYFSKFLSSQLVSNLYLNNTFKFSYLGSTKHIITKLNASYLQACLSQVCASLNSYIAAIELKFNHILNKSSIKDNELLHQIRTINSNHLWLYKHKKLTYYPTIIKFITDDFGNLVPIQCKHETIISEHAKRLTHKLFKQIIKARVQFPNIDKPKLILDTRTVDIEFNKQSKEFDLWLNISTLIDRKKVLIPLKTYDYFNEAYGVLGNTIELNFNQYAYNKNVGYKFNKKYKKKFNYKAVNVNINNKKVQSKDNKKKLEVITSDREIKIFLNKKSDVFPLNKSILKQKTTITAFDIGLCTFIATSEGELLGQNWLNKLYVYDEKITQLAASRQSCGLNVRSKRYDELIKQVRGFIKSEINRILNSYFKNDSKKDMKDQIKTVVIEKLHFNNPDLSKRLNRIIKNFGLKLFKDKLEELSKMNGFEIEEINPAYTSQECNRCHYVAKNNRKTQSLFECKCCGLKEHADVNGGRVMKERYLSVVIDNLAKNKAKSKKVKVNENEPKSNEIKVINKTMNKAAVLQYLTEKFIIESESLILRRIVSRRKLTKLLKENSYFKSYVKYNDVKLNAFVNTTEALGLEPMTVVI